MTCFATFLFIFQLVFEWSVETVRAQFVPMKRIRTVFFGFFQPIQEIPASHHRRPGPARELSDGPVIRDDGKMDLRLQLIQQSFDAGVCRNSL